MTRNEIITLVLLGALVLLLLAVWDIDRRRKKRGEHRAMSGVIGTFDEVFHPEAARAMEIREVQRELPEEMPSPDSNATNSANAANPANAAGSTHRGRPADGESAPAAPH